MVQQVFAVIREEEEIKARQDRIDKLIAAKNAMTAITAPRGIAEITSSSVAKTAEEIINIDQDDTAR